MASEADVRISTGVRLHYTVQGDPDGDAVLFLHGWPDSWFSFSRVLPLISRQHRVYAIDQRGFGDSERSETGYAIEDLASDVVAFLDAAGIERTTIVGHSFGSFVGRSVAAANPERVARLVLIGSGVSAANRVTREVQAAMADLPEPVPEAFAREFQAGTAYAPLPDEFFDRIVRESLKLPARLWREAFDRLLAFDDRDRLGQIKAPTLLIWGERDVLFSRKDQDGLLAAIPGARLKVYVETGHCPNWERPEGVAADLGAFVRE
jgi:pimeloyl-ACP methyl ester carboxylesterase